MTTNFYPLGGGKTGGGSRTDFDPTILDVTTPSNPSAVLIERGDTVSYTDFSSGTTEGFNPNMGGYDEQHSTTQVSTAYPLTGSHTLLLSTSESESYTLDTMNRNADAVKRMTLVNDDWDVLSVSMMFALVGDGVPSATQPGHDATRPYRYPWNSFFLGFDMQEPTASDGRRFPVLMLRDRSSASSYQTPAWFIMPDRYDAAGNATGAALSVIPGTSNLFTGGNERKGGYTYARLTYKRGVGYIEAQINNQVFDLRGLGAGLGRDKHLDTSSWDCFRSGFNVIFALNRSSVNPTYTSNRAYIDHVWVTVGDKITD